MAKWTTAYSLMTNAVAPPEAECKALDCKAGEPCHVRVPDTVKLASAPRQTCAANTSFLYWTMTSISHRDSIASSEKDHQAEICRPQYCTS